MLRSGDVERKEVQYREELYKVVKNRGRWLENGEDGWCLWKLEGAVGLGGVVWFRIEMLESILPSSDCDHAELKRHVNDNLGEKSFFVLMDAR